MRLPWVVSRVFACALLCAAVMGSHTRVRAQDGGIKDSKIVKQFTQNLQLVPDVQNSKKLPPNDPQLVSTLSDKLAQCYVLETEKPLTSEEQALLSEYAPNLLSQFAAALSGTTCELGKPVAPACLSQLAKLDCEPFAEVVRTAGWDRRPSPEMEAAIAKYTAELGERYLVCRSGGQLDIEEVKVRARYAGDSAAVQIAMLLTTGQCSLDMDQLDNCLARITSPEACTPLEEHAKHSRLPRFCREFLDCSAEPALVGKIAQ